MRVKITATRCNHIADFLVENSLSLSHKPPSLPLKLPRVCCCLTVPCGCLKATLLPHDSLLSMFAPRLLAWLCCLEKEHSDTHLLTQPASKKAKVCTESFKYQGQKVQWDHLAGNSAFRNDLRMKLQNTVCVWQSRTHCCRKSLFVFFKGGSTRRVKKKRTKFWMMNK